MPKRTPTTKRLYDKTVEAYQMFLTLSPKRKAGSLSRLRQAAEAEKDAEIKEFLTNFISILSEVKTETIETADLEKLKTAAAEHLPDVEEIRKGQLETLEDLEALKGNE